ncbi:alpha/beta hydrolase family protein [Lysobacter panacisoli]|uniref:S9 family peptidase n=1 Tax=Lysobacter panacisoli TaxID=1255263 RepID=A0ABP9LPX1_9GAMM|nr:S9 family peptidase [Lysobacter panacisoli]
MKHARIRLFAALFAAAPALLPAQVIPAEDFSRHSEVSEVAMSPDGRHVAMAVPTADGLETQLHIVPLDNSGKVQVLRFSKQQHVSDIVWTADDQVVVARAKVDPLETEPKSYGELLASNITGKDQEVLFAYIPDDGTKAGRRKDEGFASIVDRVDDKAGIALVDFTRWFTILDQKSPTTIFRVNTRTGERTQEEFHPYSASFAFDSHHKARVRVSWSEQTGAPILAYRPRPADDWKPVPAKVAGYSMQLLHVADDDDTALALISDKGEPAQLYRLSLANGTRERVAGRDDMDVAGVLYGGYRGAPFGVLFNAGKPSVQYLDPKSEWAGLHAGLMKAFPGQLVWLRSFSRDNRKVLFTTSGDRTPGAYYVFDRDSNQVQLINEAQPWIKSERLAPMTPVSFQTRDGLTLHGLYTAPAGAKGPLPMIVMPHGGPHGPYDAWGYNRDAQFLASRGYAVLQVNFRGSGGRGWAFEYSGYGEWGGKMMDDIADGVRWAIDNGRADASRICTYGASFGGYAALMNPIRYPELYRCAVGYVGVYDLPLMKKVGDPQRGRGNRNYLDRALGTDEAVMIANSPARNATKIKVPVMLVQGSADTRVPMDQFDAMVTGFRKAGVSVETMVVKGEGHGFYKPENRAELYRRLEAFLARNLGPGAGAAPATAK